MKHIRDGEQFVIARRNTTFIGNYNMGDKVRIVDQQRGTVEVTTDGVSYDIMLAKDLITLEQFEYDEKVRRLANVIATLEIEGLGLSRYGMTIDRRAINGKIDFELARFLMIRYHGRKGRRSAQFYPISWEDQDSTPFDDIKLGLATLCKQERQQRKTANFRIPYKK